MITRIVKISLDPIYISQFTDVFEKHKELISNCDGCKSLILLQDIREKNCFFTYSTWESELYLESYKKSELFGKIWPLIKPWFSEKAEAWTLVQH